MSDFKSMFRAAQAQRGGSSAPSKDQIKQLKAQKLAQATAVQHAAAPGPAAAARPAAMAAPSTTAAAVAALNTLPADFFQAPTSAFRPQAAPTASKPTSQAPSPAPVAQPAAAARAAALPAESRAAPSTSSSVAAAAAAAAVAAAAPAPSALPQGFFADRTADAKARGIKLPDAKDKETEFQEFSKTIQVELQEAAEQEAEEQAEEADERFERERFEQEQLLRHLEELKRRKAAGGRLADGASGSGIAATSVLPEGTVLPPAKRRRVADALAELIGGEDDEEDDELEDELLDWRAKTV